MKLWVVVTAAGRSRRMGGTNKLLLPLAGRPVLVHSLDLLGRHAQGVVVTAPPGEEAAYERLLREHGVAGRPRVLAGGDERQHSVFAGLQSLEDRARPEDAVAIHDAARPFVTAELLGRLLAALPAWDGVVPGVPVKDTIKRVGPGGRVLETLPRHELVAVQTPQIFRYETVLAAHRRAAREGLVATDDAALVERWGGRVGVVEGDYRNLKITTAEDLLWAERLLDAERA